MNTLKYSVLAITVLMLCTVNLISAKSYERVIGPKNALRDAGITDETVFSSPNWGTDLDSTALHEFIIDYMDSHHIPGLGACLIKDGEVIFSGSYGYADIARNVEVSEETLFMLASISKTVTSTALMQLYEEGAFELDDHINDYLPFAVIHPDHPNTLMTFAMLLSHVSSIRDNWGVMPYYQGDPTTILGEYLESYLVPGGSIYNANQNFYNWQPGTGYGYCNNAMALVGHLVEAISGQPFNEYCNENIFAPLEMDNSAWFLSELNVNDVALPYVWTGGNYFSPGHYGYSDYPSGQLRTSAVQLGIFLNAYLNYGEIGGTRILDSTTVALMTTPYFPGLDPTQGLAWYSMYLDGRQIWGHGGGDTGVTTEMYMCKEQNSAVVLLTNGESFFFDIMDALFDYAQGYNTQLEVVMTPDNPPVQIPAGGGSFEFDISIENLDPEEAAMLDAWIEVVLPDSAGVNLILLRPEITLPGGVLAERFDMVQSVPDYAPSGMYNYIAYAGLYPGQSVSSASFTFEKMPGDDAYGNNLSWRISGWEDGFGSVSGQTRRSATGFAASEGEEAGLTVYQPLGFEFINAYPNPFNPRTTISFELRDAGFVSLDVFDITGRAVGANGRSPLQNRWMSSGYHEIVWDASGVSSGVYLVRLEALSGAGTRQHRSVKTILIK